MSLRLDIVGSSHVGALKLADDRAKAAFPGLETRYFAMTDGLSAAVTMENDGRIHCPGVSDEERERLLRINGQTELATHDVDHIWVVGPRMRLMAIQRLLRNHSIVGSGKTSKGLPITWNFAEAAMGDMVLTALQSQVTSYRADPRVTLTPAPYPGVSAVQRGPGQDRPMTHVRGMTQAKTIEARFERILRIGTEAAGWAFLPQPPEIRDGPFDSNDRYIADLYMTLMF